jgi:hypothetical protein
MLKSIFTLLLTVCISLTTFGQNYSEIKSYFTKIETRDLINKQYDLIKKIAQETTYRIATQAENLSESATSTAFLLGKALEETQKYKNFLSSKKNGSKLYSELSSLQRLLALAVEQSNSLAFNARGVRDSESGSSEERNYLYAIKDAYNALISDINDVYEVANGIPKIEQEYVIANSVDLIRKEEKASFNSSQGNGKYLQPQLPRTPSTTTKTTNSSKQSVVNEMDALLKKSYNLEHKSLVLKNNEIIQTFKNGVRQVNISDLDINTLQVSQNESDYLVLIYCKNMEKKLKTSWDNTYNVLTFDINGRSNAYELSNLFKKLITIDENTQNNEPFNIVGKWVGIKSETYINGMLEDTNVNTLNEDCKEYLEFKEDNTYANYSFYNDCSPQEADKGTYIKTTNQLTLTPEETNEEDSTRIVGTFFNYDSVSFLLEVFNTDDDGNELKMMLYFKRY